MCQASSSAPLRADSILTNHVTTSSLCRAYRRAAAGVQEEVGCVGSDGGLGGDGPVTQSHANDGSHVGLCAKDMNWDPGGFSCRGRVSESVESDEIYIKKKR